MVLSLYHWRWLTGPKNTMYRSSSSNPESQRKTLPLNGSTEHTAMSCLIFISSELSEKSVR